MLDRGCIFFENGPSSVHLACELLRVEALFMLLRSGALSLPVDRASGSPPSASEHEGLFFYQFNNMIVF